MCYSFFAPVGIFFLSHTEHESDKGQKRYGFQGDWHTEMICNNSKECNTNSPAPIQNGPGE